MRNPDFDTNGAEHQEEPESLLRWAIIAVLGTICVSALGVGIVLVSTQ
jgi:hypothetical protein